MLRIWVYLNPHSCTDRALLCLKRNRHAYFLQNKLYFRLFCQFLIRPELLSVEDGNQCRNGLSKLIDTSKNDHSFFYQLLYCYCSGLRFEGLLKSSVGQKPCTSDLLSDDALNNKKGQTRMSVLPIRLYFIIGNILKLNS